MKKTKIKIRENVLNVITVITFLGSVLYSFVNTEISLILLLLSFVIAIFNLLLGIFWNKLNELKRKENGKQPKS